MFLDPRMKIYVQGSEVRARGLLSPPCNMKEYEVNIDRLLNRDDLEFSRIHRPLPYNITVNVRRLYHAHRTRAPLLESSHVSIVPSINTADFPN